jgi:hypothetical protein
MVQSPKTEFFFQFGLLPFPLLNITEIYIVQELLPKHIKRKQERKSALASIGNPLTDASASRHLLRGKNLSTLRLKKVFIT